MRRSSGARRRSSTAEAVGRVSAELIAPYPPGVPVLAPGELVTERALGALLAARDDGVRIAYARSPGLETIDVLAATVSVAAQLSLAAITGACVGTLEPPAGSGVTSTWLTPSRLPGTSTSPLPLALTSNSALVGCGACLPWTSQTS